MMEHMMSLSQVSGVDRAWPISVHQLTAAMYYLLAKRRGERGANPDLEHEEHRTCGPISDELLQDLLFLAPLPLHFMYCANPVEMQLKAAQQGWRLLFCHHLAQPAQPAFAMLCHPDKKVKRATKATGLHLSLDITLYLPPALLRVKAIPWFIDGEGFF